MCTYLKEFLTSIEKWQILCECKKVNNSNCSVIWIINNDLCIIIHSWILKMLLPKFPRRKQQNAQCKNLKMCLFACTSSSWNAMLKSKNEKSIVEIGYKQNLISKQLGCNNSM